MDDYDLYLLTQEGCPHCADAKKTLKDSINKGKVKIMKVEDNNNLEMAQGLGIDGVPVIIAKNKVTEFQERCELSDDFKKAICKSGKEHELC